MQTTSPRDLLRFEFAQRTESGYDVSSVADAVHAALDDPVSPDAQLLQLYRTLLDSSRLPDWRYEEPDDLEAILASLPTQAPTIAADRAELAGKVHGAWLGRCIGCNLGKAVEWGEHWTPEHIRAYLLLAVAWPLRDYIPALDPMPAGFELHDSWPETTLGNIDGSARDDDIDYAMLALLLVETYGAALSPADVALEWQSRLPYLSTYTAERAVYRNLVNEVPADVAADVNNPYREWIGAQIRGDVFGYVNPGDPRRAAVQAYQDARLSHRGNGIYGEMWSAALVASAFVCADAYDALVRSLEHVPPRSRLYEAVAGVLADHAEGVSWETARERIEQRFGHYYWVHTVNNAALVAAGLLWSDGDFTRAIGLTVSGGNDTDSNAATVGSVAGILAGVDAIPAYWSAPLHDTIRSALAGFDGTSISSLVQRTLAVIAASAD